MTAPVFDPTQAFTPAAPAFDPNAPFTGIDKPPEDGDVAATIKRAAGGVIGDLNQVIGAVNSPLKGLAGIAGLVKGAVTPGDSADNASQRFMVLRVLFSQVPVRLPLK